ncbi:MAG: AI-2E family transporter [Actinomycetota bacterium]
MEEGRGRGERPVEEPPARDPGEPSALHAESEAAAGRGFGPGPGADADDHRWVYRAIYRFIFLTFGLIAGLWLFNRLRNLFVILLVALFVSFALEPAVSYLARRGWRRGAATGFVFAVVGFLSLLMLFVIGRLVVDQVAELVEQAPELVEEAATWANDTFDIDLETEGLQDRLADEGGPLRQTATDIAGRAFALSVSAIGLLFNFFTMLLFAFYLTADGPRVRRSICSLLPPDKQRAVLEGWEIAIEKTGGYLYSRALLAGLSATLMTIFLSIVGVRYQLALGIFMGVTSQFVPTIGTYIGGALPVFIALLDSPSKGLLTLIYIVVYQQVENYFISPRITAKTMSLHPAVAFGTVIVGASLAGGIGALLALPAAAVMQAIGSTYVKRHEVIESEMVEVRTAPQA